MPTTTTPFSFILFGASGNLAKLKLYPALYILALKKRLPENFSIVGYARSGMDDIFFRSIIAESIRASLEEVNEDILKRFLSHCHYVHGQYDSVSDYKNLEAKLQELEKEWPEPVRLTYLSIPPQVIPDVLHGMCASGVRHKNGKFRCIVEKPVGHDIKSFEEIQNVLKECLDEEEIYLLDHYLGKEAVRNIYYLRFANPVLERLFKNTLIRHVEIIADEAVGIEERAGYFEHTGTFRDMFQSHLLEMISLLTMRLRDTDDLIQETRQLAMSQIYLPPASNLAEIALQGQYTSGMRGQMPEKGYKDEEGVAGDSRTNTFATLKLFSRESRWQGVPFYLRSGKKLPKKETRVSIEFQVPHLVGKGSSPNRLHIILQGEAGMKFELQTKLGGTEPAFRPLILEDPLVCMGDCLPEHGLLLLEAIHGNRTWFLSFEEVRTAWRIIDPIQTYFDQPGTPLHEYPAGSKGPAVMDPWMEHDGVKWF
jgi:glucose-6-phosphate 1-dehydrogenase